MVAALLWLGVAAAIIKWSGLPAVFHIPLLGLWAVLATVNASWRQYRPALVYKYSEFRADDDGIEIRRGVFFRSVINVPRSRVQHTDVSQGPLERRLGLGTLQIFTAGVTHASVPLPGLAHERALTIRDTLLPQERALTTRDTLFPDERGD